MWIETKNDLPPVCTEVLGWHPTWVDEDFNPEGVRMCYLDDDHKEWQIAIWDSEQDEWCARSEGWLFMGEIIKAPSHWMQKPTPPKKLMTHV